MIADPELMMMTLPVIKADHQAVEAYSCAERVQVAARIHVIGGDQDPIVTLADLYGWREHTDDVDGHDVRRRTLLPPRHSDAIAELLSRSAQCEHDGVITDDPIVIIRHGRRGARRIDTPAALWTALSESRELIGPLPRDRGWPLDDMLSLSRVDGWADVCDAGGFLDDAAAFDPAFFGISPARGGRCTSPDQRVAMRVAWKALENSGINPAALDGEEAGCFVGMSTRRSTAAASRPTSTPDTGPRHGSLGASRAGSRTASALSVRR